MPYGVLIYEMSSLVKVTRVFFSAALDVNGRTRGTTRTSLP